MVRKFIPLNLTPGFEPYGPGLRHEAFVFPGGEPHIKLLEAVNDKAITITTRVRSFNDLGLLLVANDALRRGGAEAVRLLLPYFPAARQDRVMVPGEPLTVKVYTDLVNAQRFDQVTVFDPHSEVTPALLDRVTIITNTPFISRCIPSLTKVALVSPDAGALKKIYRLSKDLGGLAVIECGKQRDVTSGKLSGFKVHGDDLGGADCLIVDDICDGGSTFIGLAEALAKHNAGKLFLAISHGIFSRGVAHLLTRFERLFTTDSVYTDDAPGVQVISMSQIVEDERNGR